MTYIKYNYNNPFNTDLINYSSEAEAFYDGCIKAGQYEIELIKNREAVWFNNKLYLIRDARKILLDAFDRYKSNVQYGIIKENNILHEEILAWYKSLLDLKDTAFTKIPDEIKYYMQ